MSVKTNLPINNFNSGELGPLLEARFDLAKYAAGCKTLENAFSLVEGGVKKMPGTIFAGRTLDDKKARFAPFQFSTGQGAVLEFTEEKIRIWQDGGLVLGYPTSLPTDYSDTVTYHKNDTVTVGCWTYFDFTVNGHAGELYIAAPVAQPSARYVSIVLDSNTSDSLSVIKIGPATHQHIHIYLAKTTGSYNQPALIQAAIRALVSLVYNEYTIDLTAWVVSASANYRGYPPTSGVGVMVSQVNNVSGLFEDVSTPTLTGDFPFDPAMSSSWDELDPEQAVIELTTPYAEEDLFTLDVNVQSADLLYIYHSDYPPASVSRHSAGYWTYDLLSFRGTADVISTGYSALGQTIAEIHKADHGWIKLDAKTDVFITGDRIYLNLCTGMPQLDKGEYIIESTSFSESHRLQCVLLDPDTGAYIDTSDYDDYLGGGIAVKVEDLFTIEENYPSCGTLYEQRMILAGSNNNPTRVNGSVQGDYPDFICDPNADDYAIQFDLVSQKVDAIRWAMGSPNALLLGTAGGVWAMYGSGNMPLTQVNVNAAMQIAIGVGNVAPQWAGDCAIWVTRSAGMVKMLMYNFVSNQWEATDLTRLNKSITKGATRVTSGIVQTAFQSEPYPIFFGVRADGQLLGMTFERQEQIYAWFRIVTTGTIESVAIISQDNDEDQIWIVVARMVNGSLQRHVEYFARQEIYHDLANAWFVHAGLQWDGGAAVDITAITQDNPCQVTAEDHGFETGQHVQIAEVLGMTQINQDASEAYAITVVDEDNFTLDDIDSTLWSAYTTGGTVRAVLDHVAAVMHLVGQTVTVIGDGAILYQGLLASDGNLNFGAYANLVTIGIPFVTTIEPMNPTVGSQQATSRGSKQKVRRATFCFYETIGCKYGLTTAKLYEMPDFEMGEAPQLLTGDITKDLPGEWGDEVTISIVHDYPFPLTLKAIIPRLDVNEA